MLGILVGGGDYPQRLFKGGFISEDSNYLLEVIRQNIALLGDVIKLFVLKSLLTMPSNVLPLHLEQSFPPKI